MALIKILISLLFLYSHISLAQNDPVLPGAQFVLLPGGTFFMGSPASETGRQQDELQHQVTLTKAFSIMTTEVTQRQWIKVMDENPSEFSVEFYCPDTYEKIKDHDACPEHPVDSISYEDVEKFLKKLNKLNRKATYTLPTESQWEYAARAGSQTRYHFGEDGSQLHLYAWYEFNSFDQTHQSAQLKPNAWGLYDMYGNVLEWTQNWFYPYPKTPVKNPRGPKDGQLKSIRGGAFNLSAQDLRSASRLYLPIDFPLNQFGLRLVRYPK